MSIRCKIGQYTWHIAKTNAHRYQSDIDDYGSNCGMAPTLLGMSTQVQMIIILTYKSCTLISIRFLEQSNCGMNQQLLHRVITQV